MTWLKEFKTFAMRGNVIDMAVGIIIGAAFTKVVSSLVTDLIMPPLGYILGGVDLSDYKLVLKQATGTTAAVTFNYGQFLNSAFEFLIVAFAVFLLIKAINQLKTKEAAAPTTTRECPYCLMAVPLKAKRCAHCTSELK